MLRIVYYRMSTIEQNTGNAQADKKECLMQEKKLEMYGGLFGGLIPLIVLVGGLVWLSVAERGGTKPFWACAWIALCVGIFFAKNKEEYCKAAMRGIGDRTGIVIVTAWLLAAGRASMAKQEMEVRPPMIATGLPQRASGMSGKLATYLYAVMQVNR